MHTVIRFIHNDQQLLEKIGNLINEKIPGSYKSIDRRGGRFSISLSSDGEWVAQRDAILGFCKRLSTTIETSKSEGVEIQIDVAIDPEDRQSIYVTTYVDHELAALIDKHFSIVFTVYK